LRRRAAVVEGRTGADARRVGAVEDPRQQDDRPLRDLEGVGGAGATEKQAMLEIQRRVREERLIRKSGIAPQRSAAVPAVSANTVHASRPSCGCAICCSRPGVLEIDDGRIQQRLGAVDTTPEAPSTDENHSAAAGRLG